jgi:hypothetical protein
MLRGVYPERNRRAQHDISRFYPATLLKPRRRQRLIKVTLRDAEGPHPQPLSCKEREAACSCTRITEASEGISGLSTFERSDKFAFKQF